MEDLRKLLTALAEAKQPGQQANSLPQSDSMVGLRLHHWWINRDKSLPPADALERKIYAHYARQHNFM